MLVLVTKKKKNGQTVFQLYASVWFTQGLTVHQKYHSNWWISCFQWRHVQCLFGRISINCLVVKCKRHNLCLDSIAVFQSGELCVICGDLAHLSRRCCSSADSNLLTWTRFANRCLVFYFLSFLFLLERLISTLRQCVPCGCVDTVPSTCYTTNLVLSSLIFHSVSMFLWIAVKSRLIQPLQPLRSSVYIYPPHFLFPVWPRCEKAMW